VWLIDEMILTSRGVLRVLGISPMELYFLWNGLLMAGEFLMDGSSV
jgi:hypothetical protein